jgi:hypothetical protein
MSRGIWSDCEPEVSPSQVAECAHQASLAAALEAAEAAQAAKNTQAQHPQQVLKAEPATADATDRGTAANTSPRAGAMGVGQAAGAAPVRDEPATLALGVICERLGFIVQAAFLTEVLHIKPAALSPRKTPLYTESQFQRICSQIGCHVHALYELYAGEPA